MDVVKVVVLGAPQVGKSTLVQQFAQCSPCEIISDWSSSPQRRHPSVGSLATALKNGRHFESLALPPVSIAAGEVTAATAAAAGAAASPTPTLPPPPAPPPLPLPRRTYYPAVVLDNRLYTLRLHDLPCVARFPDTALDEWRDCCGAGVRSAAAYLLVFDLTAPETFGYVRHIRRQMLASRSMHRVPVVVVGNKKDRLAETSSGGRGGGGGGGGGGGTGDRCGRDLQTVVRKLWKWSYVECSALYNYRVQHVFRELTAALAALEDNCNVAAPVPTPGLVAPDSHSTRHNKSSRDQFRSNTSLMNSSKTEAEEETVRDSSGRNSSRRVPPATLCSRCIVQ